MADSLHENPFTPTFGQVPANMAGRDPLLREMRAAFGAQARTPEHTMLLSGARGSGKTVLLASIADEAGRNGWIAVSTAASHGMLEDILVQAVNKASHLVDTANQKRSLTGVGIGQILSLEWEQGGEQPANWRLKMQNLISALEEAESGLLVLVDELDPSVEEAAQLREHVPGTLAAAGRHWGARQERGRIRASWFQGFLY